MAGQNTTHLEKIGMFAGIIAMVLLIFSKLINIMIGFPISMMSTGMKLHATFYILYLLLVMLFAFSKRTNELKIIAPLSLYYFVKAMEYVKNLIDAKMKSGESGFDVSFTFQLGSLSLSAQLISTITIGLEISLAIVLLTFFYKCLNPST